MNATSTMALFSGRAQDRLLQLQRAVSDELRSLNTQQSLLYGALQACDVATQKAHLQDYLGHINAVLAALVRLRAFVGRHDSDLPRTAPSDSVYEEFKSICE